MSAATLVQGVTQALFLLISVMVTVDAVRHPRRFHIDIALLFGTVSLIIVLGPIVAFAGLAPGWIVPVLAEALLMLLPYWLVRLVDDFADVPRVIMQLATASTLCSVLVLFVVRNPLPLWVTFLLVCEFAVLEFYAATTLVREARAATGVSRRRLQAVALGSLLLGLTIVDLGVLPALPAAAELLNFASQFLALSSGIAYYLGFAPPLALRRAWQEPEVRTFLNDIATLPRMQDLDAIVPALERGVARAVGAPSAAIGLWDSDADLLRFLRPGASFDSVRPGDMIVGRAFATQRPIFSADAERDDPTNAGVYRDADAVAVLAAPVTAGTRRLGALVAYSPRRPTFAEDDLSLFDLLARQAAITLDYARVYDALHESDQRYRIIVEGAALGVLLTDVDGRVIESNRAVGQLLGYNEQELRQRPIADLLYPADKEEDARLYGRLVKGDIDHYQVDKRYIGVDGRIVWVHVALSLVRDERGTPRYAIRTVEDIGDRKRAEAEREQLLREQTARNEAEAAVRARDQFLSIASHELRTPVTSMRGFTQLLLRQLQRRGAIDPDRLRTSLETIDQQSSKLATLVSQLLDMSRIATGKLALDLVETDVARVAREAVVAIQARSERHDLLLEAPESVPAIADPLRLEQVLVNLLDNAVKYSPEGGAVEVRVWAAGADEVSITVRDHGVGIPPDKRGHIFDRFYQAHADGYFGGMGLGLYITREIVELHGGTVEPAFPPDGGVCFTVTLPRQLGQMPVSVANTERAEATAER